VLAVVVFPGLLLNESRERFAGAAFLCLAEAEAEIAGSF
jgi:hypothetical protein